MTCKWWFASYRCAMVTAVLSFFAVRSASSVRLSAEEPIIDSPAISNIELGDSRFTPFINVRQALLGAPTLAPSEAPTDAPTQAPTASPRPEPKQARPPRPSRPRSDGAPGGEQRKTSASLPPERSRSSGARQASAHGHRQENTTSSGVLLGGKCQIQGGYPKCAYEVGKGGKVKLATLGTMTLERVTNMNKCAVLKKAGKLEPSARGVYGNGIYLATNCTIGYRKMDPGNRDLALAEGGYCCIRAKVSMKHALLPLRGIKSSWLTGQMAKEMGADSVWVQRDRVKVDRESEPEFMVFKPEQVVSFTTEAWEPEVSIRARPQPPPRSSPPAAAFPRGVSRGRRAP